MDDEAAPYGIYCSPTSTSDRISHLQRLYHGSFMFVLPPDLYAKWSLRIENAYQHVLTMTSKELN